MNTNKVLIIDPGKCTDCRICELVCSFYHNKSFNPRRSRISVLRDDEKAISIPMVCQQCDTPLCQEACPADAIHRHGATRAMLIDYNKCIGCNLCIVACPFGGVSIDLLTSKVMKCDFCDGNVWCAKYCPRKAIEYVLADKVGIARKKVGAEKISGLMSLIVKE